MAGRSRSRFSAFAIYTVHILFSTRRRSLLTRPFTAFSVLGKLLARGKNYDSGTFWSYVISTLALSEIKHFSIKVGIFCFNYSTKDIIKKGEKKKKGALRENVDLAISVYTIVANIITFKRAASVVQ
jgi:hypothetical protein